MPKKTSSQRQEVPVAGWSLERQADAAPVRKEHPCRDDLKCQRVVDELHKRMAVLRDLPCPNVDGVRMIDSMTAASVSLQTNPTDVAKRNKTPAKVDDQDIKDMMEGLIQHTAKIVCHGGCASQRAHEQDQKDHPGLFRQCPK
jgi:hypothetical protein